MDHAHEAHAPLRPFSLTYVVYPDGSKLGWLAALVSMSPPFIIVSLVTLLASRPDCHSATLLAGQLLNEALNYVLKHIIREPRPNGGEHAAHMPKWGMPSNHAQFAGFLASYVVLWALLQWGSTRLVRWASAGAAIVGAAAVCLSRVHLGYHSVRQVLVGAAVGAVAGAVWYAFTEACLRPRFARVAALPLARAFFLRDAGPCPHVLKVEYEAVCAEAKVRGGVRRR